VGAKQCVGETIQPLKADHEEHHGARGEQKIADDECYQAGTAAATGTGTATTSATVGSN
jgi:hypothetical protein